MYLTRTPKSEQNGDNAGFTLLEVLMALVVLSVGVLAVIKVQLAAIDSNAHSRRISDASNHAVERVEELMTISYAELVDGQTSEGAYSVEWEVFPNVPVANAKTVVVKVNHSRDKEKRFYYMKYDKI